MKWGYWYIRAWEQCIAASREVVALTASSICPFFNGPFLVHNILGSFSEHCGYPGAPTNVIIAEFFGEEVTICFEGIIVKLSLNVYVSWEVTYPLLQPLVPVSIQRFISLRNTYHHLTCSVFYSFVFWYWIEASWGQRILWFVLFTAVSPVRAQ